MVRRTWACAWILWAACTEPNPSAGDDTGGTDGTTASTTASTTAGTTASTTETTTASTTASTTDPSGDPTTDATESADDTVGDSTTGEVSCGGGTSLCLPAPPMGWDGPVALITNPASDPMPECTAGYGTFVQESFDLLVGGAHDCDCSCDPDTGAPDDAACVVTLRRDNQAGCNGIDGNYPIGTSCSQSPTSASGAYWRADATPPEGTCSAMPSEMIATPQFTTRLTVCASEYLASEGCEQDSVCAPIPVAPFETTTCIFATGDMECPADLGYDTRLLRYGGFEDTRDCSACTCALEGECVGSIRLFSTSACSDLPVASAVVNGNCGQVNFAIESAQRSDPFTVDAQCNPSGGDPIGAATETDPVTLCCRE